MITEELTQYPIQPLFPEKIVFLWGPVEEHQEPGQRLDV
jgi:hypothetical protein